MPRGGIGTPGLIMGLMATAIIIGLGILAIKLSLVVGIFLIGVGVGGVAHALAPPVVSSCYIIAHPNAQ